MRWRQQRKLRAIGKAVAAMSKRIQRRDGDVGDRSASCSRAGPRYCLRAEQNAWRPGRPIPGYLGNDVPRCPGCCPVGDRQPLVRLYANGRVRPFLRESGRLAWVVPRRAVTSNARGGPDGVLGTEHGSHPDRRPDGTPWGDKSPCVGLRRRRPASQGLVDVSALARGAMRCVRIFKVRHTS